MKLSEFEWISADFNENRMNFSKNKRKRFKLSGFRVIYNVFALCLWDPCREFKYFVNISRIVLTIYMYIYILVVKGV